MSGGALSAKYIAQNATAYWRHSNLSYLQYLSISSNLLRNVVKPDLKLKAAARGNCCYVNHLSGGGRGERENDCFFVVCSICQFCHTESNFSFLNFCLFFIRKCHFTFQQGISTKHIITIGDF